uniref:Tyrosine-protein kinase receptor n=1 Tax=Culicoides sonorensis TaxID=179676 RepID=A0A336M6T9_CULSO
MLESTKLTTSINDSDNKISCFILKTIHYKKRRREKNTMMILQQLNNNSHQMENIQCLLCLNAQNTVNSNVTAEPGVCHSVDIRNKPENLKILENCTVIEGFLQILLIDQYDTSAFENYSFPKLVEVTDYVMLYRVNGLLTLRTLFPNLKVIRGNHIFENQALIIYEMLNLQEIGLISLSQIMRGAVRIEKNPNLCYVETIDWSLITTGNFNELNFIDSNKQRNACPICGKHPGNSTTIECPKSKKSTGKDTYLCWNADHCQKECPSECPGNCYDNSSCCDKTCAGGCAGPGVGRTNCTTCKYMMEYQDGKKKCVTNCSKGLYAYSSRSCITKEACINVPVPIKVKKTDIPFPFVPRDDGICEMHCPKGYFADTNNCKDKDKLESCRKTCLKCEKEKCDKVCKGITVDSIASAQSLKGCTKIEGTLEISIRSKGGTNIVKELENSLSSIEEITSNLKIVRSYPLLSLHFFKSLKRIGGVSNDPNEKSLVVIDNQNLQDLFNPNNTVQIGGGKIAFHYNPKLCLYKIEEFKKSLFSNISYDSIESMRNSNGDKIACNVTRLNVWAKGISHQFALLGWDKFEIDDSRSLLGYVLYHTEAPFQNVTLYDGRDACGMDGWEIDDVGPNDNTHPLTKLKPFTQYAYYVKTLMISSENNGGQSEIRYFKTLAHTPMHVQKLDVTSNASSEIVVTWKPPKRFNGEPDNYEIVVTLIENKDIIFQRDYCKEPLKEGEDLPTRHIDIKTNEEPKKDSCDCQNITCDGLKSGPLSEDEALEAITFEDKLQDWVYIKYTNPTKNEQRRRRDVSSLTDSPIFTSTTMKSLITSILGHKDKEKNRVLGEKEEIEETDDKQNVMFKRIFTNETKLVIKNLKHFSWYSISVRACRQTQEGASMERCSPPQYKSARTRMVPGADDIMTFFTAIEHLNNSKTAINVSWEPPKDPNGFIVSYSILYKANTNPYCVTAKEFIEKKFVLLSDLDSGNYSIQVKATSMFGDGAYTAAQFQVIPENKRQFYLVVTIISIIVAVFGGIFLFGYLYFRRKFTPQMANMKLIASVNPEYISMQYTPDEWEVPREKIIQLQELGQGSFGMVYEGIIKDLNKPGEELKCAIKTVNENATDRERINFLKEASVMKGFDTHHVVKLLGVCSSGQPTLVVMELMGNGDLKGYLRSHRPDRDSLDGPAPQPPSLRRVYQMAIEIADGMAYLAFKKFVHRDLAARNCMVAEDLTVKIGDFGMTRDIYETDYYRKGTKGLLPVRWMAPESLKDGVFTSSSDVFSYGVVLWEMATLASQPYQVLFIKLKKY